MWLSERVVPCGELDEGSLQCLSDLQQKGLIFTQSVVPVLDVVSQRKLDHLNKINKKRGKIKLIHS